MVPEQLDIHMINSKLTTYTKISSEWFFIGLNAELKAIKLLEENIELWVRQKFFIYNSKIMAHKRK